VIDAAAQSTITAKTAGFFTDKDLSDAGLILPMLRESNEEAEALFFGSAKIDITNSLSYVYDNDNKALPKNVLIGEHRCKTHLMP